ncbi:MAG TPA: efflux RND transporter periplasmic adaptor subunit [Verrucomicrobiae bacterium]|jgi:HlyD family secretion protein|nr:efflux RND transporter periplasmic adaptor subunit [Verrucomicrobiae bacterium]
MAKKKNNKKWWALAVLALAVAAPVAHHLLAKRDLPISIDKEKVARRDITETVVANGKVEAVTEVNISAEVSGEITALPVKEGQVVKKGDLLVKIRPDSYVAARDSAEANRRMSVANQNTASANLEKAKLEYERNKALFDASLISQSDFLTAKTAYDVAVTTLAAAEEQVAMAKAQVNTAEVDLTKTTIYSPLDGTISKLNSHLGERVAGTAMMAGTAIMIVSDLNEMEARVDIGEVDVVLIAIGQKAKLEVDSFKDRKFNGVVTDIANSANNNDLTVAGSSGSSSSSASPDATKFQVRIRLTDKERFLPGMSVTANVETRYHSNVLSVPIQCVTTRLPKPVTNSLAGAKGPGSNAVASAATTNTALTNAAPLKKGEEPKAVEVVWVVDGDHVKMAPVKRGISDDNYVEISDGLKDNEEVVVGGFKAINRDLADGKKVVVNTGEAKKDKEPKTGSS